MREQGPHRESEKEPGQGIENILKAAGHTRNYSRTELHKTKDQRREQGLQTRNQALGEISRAWDHSKDWGSDQN